MAIVRISATNFCQFKAIDLNVRKLGLVWIGGENRDTNAATSNGAGKSNFAKLIGWTPYGKSVDKRDKDDVVREGEKVARTEMLLDGGWKIVRERKLGSPKLELFHNDEPVILEPGQYQARIDELMGRDWKTFRNTSFFGQRDVTRFISPDTDDVERKEILHNILDSNAYAGGHQWIKTEALRLKKEADNFNAEVERAVARLAEHDLPGLQDQSRKWELRRKERVREELRFAKMAMENAKALITERPDVTGIEAKLADLDEKQELASSIEAKLVELEARGYELEKAVARRQGILRSLAAELSRAEKARDNLDGDNCPTCGSSLKTGDSANFVTHLEKEVAEASAAHEAAGAELLAARAAAKEASAAVYAARSELRDVKRALERRHGWQQDLDRARRHDDRIVTEKRRARDALLRAQAAKDEGNPFAAQIEAVKSRMRAAEKARAEAQASFEAATVERAYHEWVVRGLSPTGVPSFALDSVMPYLTERTNHYLDALADGDITVCFSTQRELKSARGEFRDKISFSWVAEGVADKQPSGGQWKKMEIATDFALMDLVAETTKTKSDLLVLDEVFEGLDPEGVDRVGYLLQKLRVDHETIFVISHVSTMQEFFEKAFIIRKEGGIGHLIAA